MKKTDQDIDALIDKTLNAFDGADRARPKPFLYTRIQSRKEKSVAGITGYMSPVLQQFGLAFIIMIIAFNIYTATTLFGNSSANDLLEENEYSFVEEFYPSTPTIDNIALTNSNP